MSDQTMDSYRRAVKILNSLFADKPIEQLDSDDIMLVRKTVFGRNGSKGYVHKILSIVRSILRYSHKELKLNVLPPQEVELPELKPSEVEFYTIEQLQKIFAEINQPTIQGVRLMAVVTAFLDCGARISELLSLDRFQLDSGQDFAKITGKGDKTRIIYFREFSLQYIREYLKRRTDDNPALFVVHHSAYEIRRLPANDVRKAFRRISKIVGFPVRPHRLRKTFATYLDDHGAGIRYIQTLLGHSSIVVTQRYIGVNPLTLRRVISEKINYGPLETMQSACMRWSRDFDRCIDCGQTDRPHRARGRCHRCYTRAERAGLFINTNKNGVLGSLPEPA